MAEAYTTAALLTTAREGLREIGYQDNLLREDYKFADILAQNQPRKIELAAFAQEPPSYLNSCIGIAIPLQHGPEAIMEYRSLGAPQILALHPQDEKVLRWKILAHSKPELMEAIELAYLRNAILIQKDDWKPGEVLRAKSIRFTGEPIQLDFFDIGLIPAIEGVVNVKLDNLLREVLATCKSVYQEYHETDPNDEALFRLVFRLVAAKLLGDRQHSDKWLSSNAQEVLREVENFYFRNTPPQAVLDDAEVQNAAWQRIRSAFSFQNLSVEALAYIYENTLVSRDTRKKQSIHATAHLLAEFIVQQLPFKELPLEECRIFEPFAGHAPFLIAALGRLRTLLPPGTSAEQRHDYFVRMLSGMESEAFACEVAGYSLILADYPNPNGWRIEKADVFTSPKLNDYLRQANIVLCNPPYESLTKEERQFYRSLGSVNKAVETLNRVLQIPPKMLGFVLPRTFVDGQMYVEVRKRIANLYNNVSVVALPDNVFNFSDAETVLLIAHGERTTQPAWTFDLVNNKRDYERFAITGETTWQVQAPTSFVESAVNRNKFDFWYTPIHLIWDALAFLPRLEEIADIHRGLEYKIPVRGNETRLFSDIPRQGFAKGLRNVPDDFEPYIIEHSTYLNMDPDLMLYEAYKLPWDKPKVIANAARKSADRWLINAVVDEQGLVCYQRFHGVWPKDDLPIEVIAALLNGPVANAFLSTHRTSRDNKIEVMKHIPIPRLSPSRIRLTVSLVREYMNYREQWYAQPENAVYFERRCRGIIRQIDGELLTAYNLPLHLEQDLLKYFEGYNRPGPVSLTEVKSSPTKRLYTSIIRVEDIRNEDGNRVIDAVIINWNPHQVVAIPMSLLPANLQEKLNQDTRLLAKVNVGAGKAEDLIFEDFKLAPEPKPYDAPA